MTDFLLIYPPLVTTGLNGPPLGIQHLAYHSIANGLRGSPIDANIAFLRELVSDRSLQKIQLGVSDPRHRAELQSYLKMPELERVHGCRTFEPILRIMEHLHSIEDMQEARIDWYQGSDAWSNLQETFLQLQPACVGLSVLSHSQLPYALYLAREFKKSNPSTRIVLGGSELGGWLGDKLRDLSELAEVDNIVLGPGERAFVDLVKCGSEKAIIVGTAIPLSATPIKASFQLDPSLYLVPQLYNVVESSGCYWNRCTHCDYITLHPEVDFSRPVDELVDALCAVQKETGVSRFHLVNETLAPTRARRLAEAVIERGSTVKWNSFVKIDRRFTAEILRMLPTGGCEFLIIGLESLSDRALDVLDKGYSGEEARAWLLAAKNAGVKLTLNFIIGIPGTTREDELETIAWLEQNPEFSLNCKVYKFVLSRISAMGRAPTKYGLFPIVKSLATVGRQGGGSSIAVAGSDELDARYTLFCDALKQIQNRARRPERLTCAFLKHRLGGCSEDIRLSIAPWLTSVDLAGSEGVTVVFDCKSGRSARFSSIYRQLINELISSREINIQDYMDRFDRIDREDVLLLFAEAGFVSLMPPHAAKQPL